ncbi:tripartite tricarboxylate transporter TctB family protein [Roseinatronobacter sp. NSM]|uniref:tripartite tricarboxylate transporter TctB family protein n=1 Tax=Roseinatronobacter sp. NSM TaxID=3457785 RepID=UPI004036ACDC
MALDRWLALAILGLCLVYGYAAWFTMDANLPRFMQRNPVWPSTFPKALAVMGAICAFYILVFQKPMDAAGDDDVDYRKFLSYNWGQALVLIVLMLVYAVCLRPLGFIGSTVGFLIAGAWVLGERRVHISGLVSVVAAGGIWWLVSDVLGIFLRPLPFFLM